MHDDGHDRTTVHLVLRGVQHLLRFALVASAIVTGVFLVFFGPLVVAPAIVMVLCYVAVLPINFLERKVRPGTTEAHMEPIFDAPSEDGPEDAAAPSAPAPPRVTRAAGEGRQRRRRVREAKQATGAKLALAIVATLIVLSTLLAAVLFEHQYVAIGAFAVFAWLLFTGAPFWFAAVTDEVEGTEEQLTGRSAPTSR